MAENKNTKKTQDHQAYNKNIYFMCRNSFNNMVFVCHCFLAYIADVAGQTTQAKGLCVGF